MACNSQIKNPISRHADQYTSGITPYFALWQNKLLDKRLVCKELNPP
jgi:hypothetical protein